MRNRGLTCLFCLLLASCVPWTVVPIGEGETAGQPASDPSAYVDSIWASRLLPAARENAVDLETARARHVAGKGSHFLVKGRGKVLSLDRSSRRGKLLIDLDPGDGTADVALLVGPVILGTAVRDAAGFIEFTDFVNQLAYADVANALNQRVLDEVVAPLELDKLPGRTIVFHGAWTAGGGGPAEVVPIEVEVE